MPSSSDPKQTPEITARRRDIVRALADLTEQHNLPMPFSIDMDFHSSLNNVVVDLRLDDDDRGGVNRWAEALGLGDVTDRPIQSDRPFIAVQARRRQTDGPTWFDVAQFSVWSACFTDGDTAS